MFPVIPTKGQEVGRGWVRSATEEGLFRAGALGGARGGVLGGPRAFFRPRGEVRVGQEKRERCIIKHVGARVSRPPLWWRTRSARRCQMVPGIHGCKASGRARRAGGRALGALLPAQLRVAPQSAPPRGLRPHGPSSRSEACASQRAPRERAAAQRPRLASAEVRVRAGGVAAAHSKRWRRPDTRGAINRQLMGRRPPPLVRACGRRSSAARAHAKGGCGPAPNA
ncbi:MAG: hypothetical protein J3K34DRAFT_218288 [Monoraphidium minutum]|nr:MAG: hypothetical protein J3K34DRAFT_218288 [Monoraphidium minutum]